MRFRLTDSSNGKVWAIAHTPPMLTTDTSILFVELTEHGRKTNGGEKGNFIMKLRKLK